MSGGVPLLLRWLNCHYCRLWHRLNIVTDPLPAGPVIVISNHRSGVDPLLIQARIARSITFVMGRDYYRRFFWLCWFFKWIGAIPMLPRGANRQALARVERCLRSGNVLCLFPEGEANPRVPLSYLYPGAAWLALRTGATILPVRITGTWPFDRVHIWRPFLRRGRAELRFGRPFRLEGGATDRQAVVEGVEMMRQALLDLR